MACSWTGPFVCCECGRSFPDFESLSGEVFSVTKRLGVSAVICTSHLSAAYSANRTLEAQALVNKFARASLSNVRESEGVPSVN